MLAFKACFFISNDSIFLTCNSTLRLTCCSASFHFCETTRYLTLRKGRYVIHVAGPNTCAGHIKLSCWSFQTTLGHRPADTYQTLGVHPMTCQCCLVICDAEPTLIKRLMNFSRLLGCCGYPVNRVKHIEGTHLRDFISDKMNPHPTRKTSYRALFRSSVRSTCRCTQWYIMPK